MLFGKKKRQIVRLLLVEDEPLVAFDTEHSLSEAKFTVVATTDRVSEALPIIEEDDAIDMLVVDVNLADGSGVDLARAAHARGVPVLFVTGNFPDEAVQWASGCLFKPYLPRDLLDAIAAIEAALDGKTTKRLPQGFRLFATV
ncbi:response regulator [Sphingomonas sp. PB2P19]|uniref:response regulator n=1 Tax=Sphingomonas rhamnosi TaxID=3096156 RepID=UPI002FC74A3B